MYSGMSEVLFAIIPQLDQSKCIKSFVYCKEDAALRLYLPFPSSRMLMSHHAVWVGSHSFLSFKPADKYLTHFFYGFKLLPLQA